MSTDADTTKEKRKSNTDIKYGTCKSWTNEDDDLHFMAVADGDPFGKPNIVFISTDRKTWIAHDPADLVTAINEERPIKVG